MRCRSHLQPTVLLLDLHGQEQHIPSYDTSANINPIFDLVSLLTLPQSGHFLLSCQRRTIRSWFVVAIVSFANSRTIVCADMTRGPNRWLPCAFGASPSAICVLARTGYEPSAPANNQLVGLDLVAASDPGPERQCAAPS